VRVADWPKVHVWNANLGVLEVVDFSTGKTVSRLYLGNDPTAAQMDPADLDKADTPLIFRIRNRGAVICDGGRYAYYIKRHPSDPREAVDVLKKIDLRADPPEIVTQGKEPEPNLFPRFAVVSEAAGSLFVVKARVGPPGLNGPMVEPTRRVLVFDTKTLEMRKEIEFPIKVENLAVSKDGKYLYGLSPESGKLAVMAVSSGKEVQVLDKLGTCPYLMLALPEEQEK
jgi:hypothetical protein